MTNKIAPPRVLFLITLALFIIIPIIGVLTLKTELPPSITINHNGQPTLGYPKAKVNVVVFEEPKCSNCRDYSEEIFPKIKQEFIDTNKITYTLIPVSFLPGSMPAAVALLCVYYSDPTYPNDELFFSYLDYIYKHQPDELTDWATKEKLTEFAKATSPAIDLSKLQNCIQMETYRIRIEQNTAYGKELMGGAISTPSVYVNGIRAEELSYDSISELIKKALEHEGVY